MVLNGTSFKTAFPFPLDPDASKITSPYMPFGSGPVAAGTTVHAATPDTPQEGIIAGNTAVYSFDPAAADPASTLRLEGWGFRNPYGIGILFALKGGYFRAFYRWLKRDYGTWFGDGSLPERTRLQRLLKTHRDWCDLFLADPSFFTVIDSYPIELIFPIRQGRSSLQVGKKGRDKWRRSCRWSPSCVT